MKEINYHVILKRKIHVKRLGIIFPSKVVLNAIMDKHGKTFVRLPSEQGIVHEVNPENIKWDDFEKHDPESKELNKVIKRKEKTFLNW